MVVAFLSSVSNIIIKSIKPGKPFSCAESKEKIVWLSSNSSNCKNVLAVFVVSATHSELYVSCPTHLSRPRFFPEASIDH